jgi:hypothetical protein
MCHRICSLLIKVQNNGIYNIYKSFLWITPNTKGGFITFVRTLLFLVKDPRQVQ